MVTDVVVRTDPRRAVTAPATWGQRAIWHCLEFTGGAEASFSLCRVVEVPDGCPVERLAAAVADLTAAHDALRTVFEYRDGGLWQTVEAWGKLALPVVELVGGDTREEAQTLARQLAGPAFPRDRWPVRVAVCTAGGRPRYLALMVSHLAVDQQGVDALAEDLRGLLAGRPVAARHRQPVDQAAYERSVAGQAASERALRYWTRVLRAGPPSTFDHPHRPVAGPRYRRLVLRSAALTSAAPLAARRARVSTTAVLLAATTVALGRYAGHRRVVLKTICANRFGAQRDLVGTLSWDGVLALDVDAPSFAAVARQAFQAGLSAYANGHYDPEAGWRLVRRLEADLGATLDLTAHLNDARSDPDGGPVVADPVELDRLTATTTLAPAACDDRVDARFYLTVRRADELTALSLICDTHVIPPSAMAELLRAVERLVLAAAFDDVCGERMARLAGPAVRRGPDWVRCGESWVDLAALRQLWRRVSGDPSAQVFADAELVCYAAAARFTDPEASHTALFGALAGRTDVRAPARYVLCERAPREADSRQAWDALPVVARGTGRPQPA